MGHLNLRGTVFDIILLFGLLFLDMGPLSYVYSVI